MKWLLAAVMASTLSGVQDKTYDLKLDWTPVKGHRSDLAETSLMKMTVSIAGKGVISTESDETVLTARETIVGADGAGGSERTWAFSTATQDKNGQKTQLAFHGRTVLIRHKKGSPRAISLQGGGELSAEHLTALKKAFMGGDASEEPGKPSGSEVFAPKKPVKVGESWNPDIAVLARGMFDDQMADSADLQKSRAVFTLKAVERRDGVEFGKVDGLVELALEAMGPMTFETPIVLRLSMSLDACIDGKLPDGVAVMKAEMKDTSQVAGPGGKFAFTFDMAMTARLTIATVK